MAYQTLLVEKEGHVTTITLNRPEVLNAWNAEMIAEFPQALAEIARDKSTRALIITGAGRGFTSGADLAASVDSQTVRSLLPDLSEERLLKQEYTVVHMGVPIQALDIPTIAAVNGPAVGAGLGVALSCDIRIASDRARFSMIFVRRAIVPDTGLTYLLPRLVGMGMACELTFTGDIIDAQEALRIRLVNRVVPHDQLMDAAREMAAKIARNPPITVRCAKRALYHGAGNVDLADQVDYEAHLNSINARTEDRLEGSKAFLEKREPLFKGK